MRITSIILSSILVFMSGCVVKPAVTEVISAQYSKMIYIGEHRFVVMDSSGKYKIIEHYDPLGIPNEWLVEAIWWEVGK